jgi:hypothetical protein
LTGTAKTPTWREGKQAVLFLKKKNQKDFYQFMPRALQHPGSKGAKVFCAASFQKSGCLLTC